MKVYQSTKYYQPSPIHVLTRKKERLKVTHNAYVADIIHVTRCELLKLIGHKNQCQIVILHVKVYQSTKYYQPSPIHVLTRKKERLKVTHNAYVADIMHVTRCELLKLIGHKNQCQIVILHVKVYQSTKYYHPSPIHVLTRKKERLKVTHNAYVADIMHVTRCELLKLIGHKNQCQIVILHVKVYQSTKYYHQVQSMCSQGRKRD